MCVTSSVVCDSVWNSQKLVVEANIRGSQSGGVKIQIFWGEMLCCWVIGSLWFDLLLPVITALQLLMQSFALLNQFLPSSSILDKVFSNLALLTSIYLF
jgi:hypothetical protein